MLTFALSLGESKVVHFSYSCAYVITRSFLFEISCSVFQAHYFGVKSVI